MIFSIDGRTRSTDPMAGYSWRRRTGIIRTGWHKIGVKAGSPPEATFVPYNADMITIAVTGAIGSGKSLAAEYIARAGAERIGPDKVMSLDADKVVHQMLSDDKAVVGRVVECFGPEMLDPSGMIDRAKLGAVVFSDAGQMATLESIIHPKVREVILAELDKAGAESVPMAVIEIPLLQKSGLIEEIDRVVVVEADHQVRLDRLVARGLDPEEARRRMAAGPDQRYLIRIADSVINNSGSLAELEKQARKAIAGLSA